MAWNSKKKEAVKFLLQEANGMHTGEMYGEKATLATEVFNLAYSSCQMKGWFMSLEVNRFNCLQTLLRGESNHDCVTVVGNISIGSPRPSYLSLTWMLKNSNGECSRGKLFNFPNFDFIFIFSSSFMISHFMIFEYFRLGLSANKRAAHEILLELISSKLFDRMLVV